MRIQHNIPAMNSYRNYTNNVSAVNKNLEKLSSGYKINRAGDDAAGLAISEKMRAQISGLKAASKNAKDGISLVKTAEGALTEVHDMLNRMVTLASQSANGTYDNETDRAQLQKELSQLRTEIDRIADSSNFNGIKLLDGGMSSQILTKGMKSFANTDAAKLKIEAIHDGTPDQEPAKIEFTVNLKDYTYTPAEDADGDFSFKLGGVDLLKDAGISQKDANNGKSLVGQILENNKGKTVTIDDIEYELSDGGDGKIKFTSVDYPTADETTGSIASENALTVNINGHAIDTDTTAKTDVAAGSNNGSGIAITVLSYGAPDNGGVLATSKFKLGDVTDGTALQIGNDTYVFAVGAGSAFKGKENVVDLTAYTGKEVDFKAIAAGALSKAAENNVAVKVEVDRLNTDEGYIYLTEKKGGLDRDKWDVFGAEAKDKADATWAGFVKKGSASIRGDGLTLQIGDTSDSYNQMNVSISDCHAAAMGIGDIDISSQSAAQEAVGAIKNAINYVSDVRGTLGATQNRLEHTINNLSVMTENIQDAESTIRDTDIAEEMMAYTKNNILVQSAQAMLAQANQIPQGVLQLLG